MVLLLLEELLYVILYVATEETRENFNADFAVWMNTIKESRFEDTNTIFEKPSQYDYQVSGWFDDTHQTLIHAIERYQKWQSKNE